MDRGWPQCQKCAITFPTKKLLHEHNSKLHYGSKPKRDNKNKQVQFQERPGERQFKTRLRLSPKYHDPVVQQIQYRIAKEWEENRHCKCMYYVWSQFQKKIRIRYSCYSSPWWYCNLLKNVFLFMF